MSDIATLFNREVRGEITPSGLSKVEQGPPEEFLEHLDAVLDIPGVECVVWEQYTPYFNDGEECIFGVNQFRVITEDSKKRNPDEWEYEGGAITTWELDEVWDSADWKTRNLISASINGTDQTELYHKLAALDKISPRHEDLLRKTFGDHAQVTATKEGFTVEYYDHE